jgi:hypothetical protein
VAMGATVAGSKRYAVGESASPQGRLAQE